jgi:hypothetical protein
VSADGAWCSTVQRPDFAQSFKTVQKFIDSEYAYMKMTVPRPFIEHQCSSEPLNLCYPHDLRVGVAPKTIESCVIVIDVQKFLLNGQIEHLCLMGGEENVYF